MKFSAWNAVKLKLKLDKFKNIYEKLHLISQLRNYKTICLICLYYAQNEKHCLLLEITMKILTYRRYYGFLLWFFFLKYHISVNKRSTLKQNFTLYLWNSFFLFPKHNYIDCIRLLLTKIKFCDTAKINNHTFINYRKLVFKLLQSTKIIENF